jgi:hypothetical protein
MARLNSRSFLCYCGSYSAERGVVSVLRSEAVKKIVPILSTGVDKLFLCLAAILNFRNARVLFVMAKRRPMRNSQFMKAIRYVHSSFQEESFKIRNKQVLSHKAIMERVCAHWRMNTGSMLKINCSNLFTGDIFNYVTN